jgi:replicative DNA helicase
MHSDYTTEQVLLAGILKYGKEADLEICDILTPECIQDEFHQSLYKIIAHAVKHNTTVDKGSLLVSSDALGMKKWYVKNRDYIDGLSTRDVHVKNLREYASKLRRLQITRELHLRVNQISDNLAEVTGDEKLDDILNIAEGSIFEFCHNVGISQDNEAEHMGIGIDDYIDDLIANPVDQMGIPTGFSYLDGALGGGIIPGGFALIGARMKVGKSTLAGQFAINTAINRNIPTLMLDFEMFKKKHWTRLIANLTQIDINEIRTGRFTQDKYKVGLVNQARAQIKGSVYSYKNVAGKSFNEILSIARRWLHKDVYGKGFTDGLILVDYFKLSGKDAKGGNFKEYELIGHQAGALSDFCIQYNVPCIAFVQLNREGINKESSDVISQSDRLGWSCTSFSIFKEKTKDEIKEDGPQYGNRKLVPLFSRDGEPIDEGNWINVQMDGKYASVREINTKEECFRERTQAVV